MAEEIDKIKSEHDLVVLKIIEANAEKWDALSNIDNEQHYIAQMFPDLILVDKATQKPVFIIEVKKNGNIAGCIQQWKTVVSIPATLYIIVPESDLATAKSVAQIVGLQTRFGSYKIDEKGNITVKYD